MQYTKEFLVSELHRFVKENNRNPRRIDFTHTNGRISYLEYIKNFKTWNNALLAANLSINVVRKYSDDELLLELKRFVIENNRSPTAKDICKLNGYPACETYKSRFGSWNNALNLANIDINKTCIKLNGSECCSICGETNTTSWKIYNNLRYCDKCRNNKRDHFHGILNPFGLTGMGVITEHIACKVLNATNCNTKNTFNFQYDLISEVYGTINVKAATLSKNMYDNSERWYFGKKINAYIPDYYLCICFNNNKTKIVKTFLINKSSTLISKTGICITNSMRCLSKFAEFEIDSTQYDKIYQNLDIYSLPEFCNLKK